MDKKLIQGFILRTIGLAIVYFTVDFILNKSNIIQQAINIKPSFLFYPIIATSIALYLASILKLLLTGELSYITVSSIKMLAATIFFSIILANPPTPQVLQPLGFWLLMATITIIIVRAAGSITKYYGGVILKTFIESPCIFTLGYILNRVLNILINTQNIEFLKSTCLPEKIYYSFLTLSILSILGILQNSRNPYLSYVGKKFGTLSGKTSTFIIIILLLFYFSDLRPIIVNLLPNYIVVIEWAAVCLTAFAIYRRMKTYVSKRLTEDLKVGEWTTHVQKIFHEKDKVVEVSKVAEEFIESGLKGGILSYLIAALVENEVPTSTIESIIGELADYEDDHYPKLTLKWELENLEIENKKRRMKVLTSTLIKASNFLGLSSQSHILEEELEGEIA
jgi:hypothetical protein